VRTFTTLLTAAVILAPSVALPAKGAKPKPPAVSQAQAQLKKVTQERDELKDRLAATESLQEDLAAAQKSRDMARQETERSRRELEQMKSALAENQGSADTILNELQKTKAELAAAKEALASIKGEAEERKEKLAAPAAEGALVPITPDITPARPINLGRITPKAKKVTGVVVVNVLVGENGEVLDTRLLQGLPGDSEWVAKGNAACVEAARRIVFDPARAADGRTKVRVWQGVGFMLE
jgi:seryl-tRNA synthetase